MNKVKFNFVFATAILLTTTSIATSATITGVAKYDGEAPKFNEIKMDADPICLSHNKEPVYPQKLVLGEGNVMANVFVYVKKGVPNTAFTAPVEPVVITQQGCMYDPHVVGVMVGQKVKILNPDGTLHNVHALSKANAEFNLAMPKFRTETEKIFDKAEFMFPMKCDVHPWMEAWVSVLPHPFFNATKADGKFNIDNLPAGTYELEAWHEKLGTQTASVTIADGESKEVNFTFAKPAK